MDEFDHADLDGDGEFDAIDIEFLEDERKKDTSQGCVIALFLLGFTSIGVTWGISKLLA